MTNEQLEKVIDIIQEKTKREAYALEIDGDRKPGIFDSKFGGVPYWDSSKEYPKNSDDEKLMLLAQINFAQGEPVHGLPDTGILQFFIQRDDVFGADFDDPASQESFRVVYHENVDETVTREQVLAMDIPVSTEEENEEYSPVFGEFYVKLQKTEAYMGEGDYRFDKVFCEAASEVTGEEVSDSSAYQLLEEEQFDILMEELETTNHWMLGYPYFTQYDPREENEEYSRYDTLLFQMDSDSSEEGNWDYVLWGDCGVAGFFINWEDLQKKDFSKVMYNWDCC